MATYYFVLAEDDVWWVRVRGRSYGGFLLRSHAVKHAVHCARRCAGEAYVVVQEPSFRWRIEWTNRDSAAAPPQRLTTEIQRIAIGAAAEAGRHRRRGGMSAVSIAQLTAAEAVVDNHNPAIPADFEIEQAD